MANGKVWLYGQEVCREIRVCPQTLADLVEAGHIRTLSIPGQTRLRYHSDDVAKILADGVKRGGRRAERLEVAEA